MRQSILKAALEVIRKENGEIRRRRVERTEELIDGRREALGDGRGPFYGSRAMFRGRGTGRGRKALFERKMTVPKGGR